MTQFLILQDLGYVVLAAALVLLLTRPLRMPPIVAYIVAGLALGQLLQLSGDSESIGLFSEIGVALLLFLVGLELSFERIRDVGRVAVLAGLGQVVFTAAGGFGLSLLLGFTLIESVFIATALTFSSTVVVVKLLDEKKELHALYGRIAVGIFLVQDLVVIVALTVLAGLASREEVGARALLPSLATAFLGMGLLLAFALGSARWLLPRLFGWLAKSTEALFIWSLCWCFLFVIGAGALGLSIEIGAFLAGISLAQLPYTRDLRRRVHPLMNFFIAVFFVTLGMQVELGAATSHWGSALVLSLFVLIGNPLIFMWIITRLGYGERTSFLTSVTVAQISEFSFIFMAMGIASGLIGEPILSLVALVGIVTIAVSAYMILYNGPLYDLVRRWGWLRPFRAGVEDGAPAMPARAGHVIVVGLNALGRRIVRALLERGERVVVIDTDQGKLEGLDVPFVLGNAGDDVVLEEANISEAKLLISALQIEDANSLLAYRCQRRGVPVSIHAFDPALIDDLEHIGVDHIMFSKHDGVRQVAAALRNAGVMP